MEVSPKIIKLVKEIGNRDGKDGITSDSERNELAELLASGEIEGVDNQKYIKREIGKYDMKKLVKDVRGFVKTAIEKALKLSGDSEHINDETELVAIESIIKNTTGKYTREEVEYAKLVREHKMSDQFALEIENGNYKRENAMLKDQNAKLQHENEIYSQKVTELMKENQELRMRMQERAQQLPNVQQKLQEVAQNIPNAEKARCTDIINRVKTSVNNIQKFDGQCKNIDAEITKKAQNFENGNVSEKDFESFVSNKNKEISQLQNKVGNEVEKIKKEAENAKDISPKFGEKISEIAEDLSQNKDGNVQKFKDE